MNIEQIAQEVAQETDWKDAAEFLRRCLSKLAEQEVESVADVVWSDPTIEPFQKVKPHKIIDGSLSFMDEARIGDKLYTETQLLAAQQRTAEACAKLLNDNLGHLTRGDALVAIRNGEWREYL